MNETEIKEINRLRKMFGLSIIKTDKKKPKRKCLNCDTIFLSEGGHNRMCEPCRKLG